MPTIAIKAAASRLDHEFARLSLAAETAKAYFLAIETKRQLAINEENLRSYDKTMDVVQAFFDEGLVSAQDIHLTRREQALAKDGVQNAKASHLSALRSLESLLGRYPSAQVEIADTLSETPDPVPVGVPSEVLERRPDIVAAERRVAAAFDKVTEAKAAKLPRISLTGSVSSASDALSELTSPANILWNAVTGLMFPILDGGKLDAQVDAATAAQKQAMANYQKTALAVFVGIENSLGNERIFRSRYESLEFACEQAKIAEDIEKDKYENGEGSLLDVLQLNAPPFQRAHNF